MYETYKQFKIIQNSTVLILSNFLSSKYDGHWDNGKLAGPSNMILPNHVFLGTFFDSLVSIIIIYHSRGLFTWREEEP